MNKWIKSLYYNRHLLLFFWMLIFILSIVDDGKNIIYRLIMSFLFVIFVGTFGFIKNEYFNHEK